MKKTLNIISILLLGILVFNTFFRNRAEADVKESYAKISQGKAIIIDVREESEVKEGMIKGALWIPLSKISSNPKSESEIIKKLGLGKEIYLYCRSGARSGKVQSILADEGIKSINLGGFSSLASENLPTQPGPQ
jgi:rhodanese-related sulfurtransferase